MGKDIIIWLMIAVSLLGLVCVYCAIPEREPESDWESDDVELHPLDYRVFRDEV